MTSPDGTTTDNPDAPDAPAPDAPAPDSGDGGDGDEQPASATELLARAGDENARRALGYPTASSLTSVEGYAGFELGKPAPSDLFRTFDGKVVSSDDAGDDGFRGIVIATEGAPVTAAALAELAAARASGATSVS